MDENLKKQYINYEGSYFFIDCVYEALTKTNTKEKQIVFFINNHFREYRDCGLSQMKKCAAHWNNVAFDKLNNYDFLNYKSCIFAVTNYRMVAKIMEDKINNM